MLWEVFLMEEGQVGQEKPLLLKIDAFIYPIYGIATNVQCKLLENGLVFRELIVIIPICVLLF